MAKFPVESDDNTGVIDALNYLLSGPSGLGQNFQGFSDYINGYLTGNYRPPFSQPTSSNLYVSPITLSLTEMLDERTIKMTFSVAQGSVPFSLGNGLSVASSINATYDDYINNLSIQIGVVECTTTYVIVRLREAQTLIPSQSGGSIYYYSTYGGDISTDCNAKVTVNGNTDRVYISAQLNNIISFDSITASDFDYTVTINRYIGYPNNDPTNPEYIFVPDDTNGKNPIVSTKTYHYYGLDNSVNPLDNVETIFSTVIDKPGSGYYWYILEVAYDAISGPIQVTSSLMELRSLSAQVVKQ